jgi:hypothetical protein
VALSFSAAGFCEESAGRAFAGWARPPWALQVEVPVVFFLSTVLLVDSSNHFALCVAALIVKVEEGRGRAFATSSLS